MINNTKKISFGIGSNLGNRQENIELAIDNLASYLNLKNLQVSRFYANKALLPLNSDKSWDLEFLNIALIAKIDLNKYQPLSILKIIKEIEKKIGRIQRPKWAPREIDIDILAIEDLKFKSDVLEIPHQGLFERDFFFKTFAQIDQQWLEVIKKNK